MAPRFISVCVKGDAKRKVRRSVGDSVRLKNPPLDLSIVRLPAPHIVSLKKKGSKVYATVQLHVEHTGPTGALVQSLKTVEALGPELETPEEVLDIGDHVMVAVKLPTVVVPLETPGVILGGNGEMYHVAFTMRKSESGEVIEPPIHVNQDRVSIEALKLVKKGNRELSAASTDEDEEDEEEDEDEADEEDDDEETEVLEEDLDGDVYIEEEEMDTEPQTVEVQGGSDEKRLDKTRKEMVQDTAHVVPSSLTSSLAYLRSTLPPAVYTTAFQQLSVNELQHFAAYVQRKGAVTDTHSLQDVIEDFRKQAPQAHYPLPAAYIAALRAAGASTTDLLKLQQDATTVDKPLRDLIRHVARFY